MNCRLPVLREKTAKLTTSPGVYLMKDQKSEIIYIGKAEIGVPLVIFQQNVILRLMLFDQAAFQNKGFIFRVGDNKIVVIHMLHHTCHFGGMVG